MNAPMLLIFASLLILTLFNLACSSHINPGTDKEIPTMQTGGTPADSSADICEPEHSQRILCVFDYDLTMSSHACGEAGDFCRTNTCGTYSWFDQCMAPAARQAFKTCIDHGAYIGINSHAGVDECWYDKVTPVVSGQQLPEFTRSYRYDNPDADFSYPAIDDRANWNCDTCAYHMNPDMDKSAGIRKVMRHYGMDGESPLDRARVIFWDDSPGNIANLNANMPEVRAILVPRAGADEGGCGITRQNIVDGWSGLAPAACAR